MIYQGNALEYIYDTPEILKRILAERNQILNRALELLKGKNIADIYLTGSGSSYHSAVAARKFMQKVLGIRVHAVYPVPFLEELDYLEKDAIIVSISQQGTSVASIQILEEAVKRGFATIAVTGEYETEITKYSDATIYVECGYEDAGATTKGYTATVLTFLLFAVELGRQSGTLEPDAAAAYYNSLSAVFTHMPKVISAAERWYGLIQDELSTCRNLVILSYGTQKATMLEGVLKFSETCRFPVRGYEAEEFMHGMYNAVDTSMSFLYLAEPGAYKKRIMKLYRYYEQQGCRQYGIGLEENHYRNLTLDFTEETEFLMLEYILVIQILFVRLSRTRGIDLNLPKDPDFHKIMNSKLEEETRNV